MSTSVVKKHVWTVNEIRMLNEACGFRLEIIDGELLEGAFAPAGLEVAMLDLLDELTAKYPGGLPDY